MSVKRFNGWKKKIVLLMLLLMAPPGCATHQRLNNSERLTQRADFNAAVTAAPEWCREALKTINRLEYELERR